MKLSLGKTGVVTVARTVVALLIGNSIVVPLLTDSKARYWWGLLLLGVAITLARTLKFERKGSDHG